MSRMRISCQRTLLVYQRCPALWKENQRTWAGKMKTGPKCDVFEHAGGSFILLQAGMLRAWRTGRFCLFTAIAGVRVGVLLDSGSQTV